MYIPIYQTENIPCSHISWVLQRLPEVSYAVALYHLRAERKGGQEGRTEQRFSTTTPEEEAESPCSPYTLKSKDPKSH